MDEASLPGNGTEVPAVPADGGNGSTLFGWITQQDLEGSLDDVFAYSKNDTLVSLYSNWPYCSALQMNATVAVNASTSSAAAAAEPDGRMALPLFEFVTSLFLLVVVAVPGILGNFISIFILSRPQMRSSLNVILIGLASFDSLLLFSSILLFVTPPIYSYSGIGEYYHRHVFPLILPYTYFMALTAQTSSVYLTVTVTIERYVAVCHPLKARFWCTCKRGRLAVVVISLFSFCYNLPRFFEIDRCLTYDKDSNEYWMVIPSDLRNNKYYITWYIVSSYFVVMNFVPFTLLAILNGAIYKKVREANRERSRLTTSQKREIGLATMLLCVVAVFFIFNIMAMVVSIFEMANILMDEMTRISNLLVSVNSSVNFIIYCIFGDKFQRLFLRYFWYCVCCCKTLRRPHSSGRNSPDNGEYSMSMGNSIADTNRITTLSASRSTIRSGRLVTISNSPLHRSNGSGAPAGRFHPSGRPTLAVREVTYPPSSSSSGGNHPF